ncbi:MAG: glucose-6-phosphate dehydrogenase [Candidatus Latescibacteria bacterium]|nr:glucose-6-phosphate dehydrogenase [Candidatus Latescibacterota bacterium]
MEYIEPEIMSEKGFCTERKPDPCGIVIFGASGDLSNRKLIPALFSLFKRDLIPDHFFIIGAGRFPLDDESFRRKVQDSIISAKNPSQSLVQPFIDRCYYISGNYNDPVTYTKISEKITIINKNGPKHCQTIFYLSTPPSVYEIIVRMLGTSGLVKKTGPLAQQSRVVIEKPFGHDLSSAMALDKSIRHYLTEDQIYRIDHYLGKETVQNILMFRFANAIFEPIWNRRYIDNIQIVVTEILGVEHRSGYYEQSGLLRDMFQNHMMQMLSLVAMEPPASFDANDVRNEKVKVLRAVRPFSLKCEENCILRAQYVKGESDGRELPGYREEKGVAPDSQIETYVSAKLMIDNWRWKGVPFYLCSGKRLKKRLSEIAIVFKEVPHSMFASILPSQMSRNILVLNVQPFEGAALRIEAKSPGPKWCMNSLNLEFRYRDVFGQDPPDAYERLLLDSMIGDQTLFIRNDDMEVAWSLFTPVLDAWRENSEYHPLYTYPAGSWEIAESAKLLSPGERYWRL